MPKDSYTKHLYDVDLIAIYQSIEPEFNRHSLSTIQKLEVKESFLFSCNEYCKVKEIDFDVHLKEKTYIVIPGPTGPTGSTGTPGPSASSYSFSLTFDNASTFKQYAGLSGKVESNDAVLIYLATNVYASETYYTQLPLTADGVTMY